MKNTIRILYKDETLAVAVKPSGLLSQPDRTGEDSMISLLAEQLGREVFPIHRLDRAVGGVMVFALTKPAAGKLSGMVGRASFRIIFITIPVEILHLLLPKVQRTPRKRDLPIL